MRQRLAKSGLVAICISFAVSNGGLAQSRVALSGYAFPSTANVQGAFNAYFKTRVILSNTNNYAINVFVGIATPSGGYSRTLNLAARNIYTYENFLDEVFGYTGGAAIGMRSIDGSAFLASAEVYVDGSNGRFSTVVPILTELDKVVATSETGSSEVVGLRANGQNRANIGCANLGAVNATITMDSFSLGPSGTIATDHTTFSLPAATWYQQSIPVQGDLIVVYFRASATDSIGSYCWGVNVNNASNDGTVFSARWWR